VACLLETGTEFPEEASVYIVAIKTLSKKQNLNIRKRNKI
jgi:hypothetical protein